MKLYLSGPMTGYPHHNRPAFQAAAACLVAAGYDVVNPAEWEECKGWRHEDYMRRDLPFVFGCDGVAVMTDAECSRGAREEIRLGRAIGLDILPVHVWIRRGGR